MEEQHHSLRPKPSRRYRAILAVIVIIFAFYNLEVYTTICENQLPPMNDQAMQGGLLWQKNNCTACHQLYGLGGYIGPDLTNVMSRPSKGGNYVKAFLNSGVNAMPKFNFSEEQKDNIVAFLTHVDRTGHFPNSAARLKKTGWVELKYKAPNTKENE